MKYCVRCILPDTRPGITLDSEGVCSACRGHDDKEHKIDWAGRARDFERVVSQARQASHGYDCIVPVSGGKDSWYQVIRCQEFGMKVLGVTWRTPARTAIGQRNLESMVRRLGIDHIDYSVSPEVERRFTKAAFVTKGATAIPMHMALFAVPIRLSVQFRVPLIVWGENPQLEFGGAETDRLATDLNLDWVAKHGVTNGTGWRDWVGLEKLTESDMIAYRLPDPDEFSRASVRSVFLGSFFKWNSFDNARIAESRGFSVSPEYRKTGVWDFADLDCDLISLHHFLKWYKFGITRAFDNLSVQIRYGMISRDQAIQRLAQVGLQVPHADIEKFCSWVGEPVEWFWRHCERFRNHDIWVRRNGHWSIPGFILPDWKW